MRRNETLSALGLLALAVLPARATAADAACQLVKLAELPVTRTDRGPTVLAAINGTPTPFLADTGAVFSMIPPAVAARLGLTVADMPGVQVGGAPAHKTEVKDFTMGGAAAGTLDLLVADLSGVAPDGAGLLGQNLLGVADVEYDLAGGVIRLFQPQGCGADSRAYWSPTRHTAAIVTLRPTSLLIEADATVNGQAMHVRFDTSVPDTVLSLKAAARVGVTPKTAGMVAAPPATVGLRRAPSWFAPVESFRLGDEERIKPRLRIADVELPAGVDMLIGGDFFAAHRIYVAKDLRRLDFTANAAATQPR